LLDDPDLEATLAHLRRSALGLSPHGIVSKLVIPNSQILYTSFEITATQAAERRSQIELELAARTPYPVEDLIYDWSGTGKTVQVATLARQTLTEAEAFAERHRFNPVCFVAIPPAGAFGKEPFFGLASKAALYLPEGDKLDRDQDPIRIIRAANPTPRLVATPEADLPASDASAQATPAAQDPEPIEPEARGSAADTPRDTAQMLPEPAAQLPIPDAAAAPAPMSEAAAPEPATAPPPLLPVSVAKPAATAIDPDEPLDPTPAAESIRPKLGTANSPTPALPAGLAAKLRASASASNTAKHPAKGPETSAAAEKPTIFGNTKAHVSRQKIKGLLPAGAAIIGVFIAIVALWAVFLSPTSTPDVVDDTALVSLESPLLQPLEPAEPAPVADLPREPEALDLIEAALPDSEAPEPQAESLLPPEPSLEQALGPVEPEPQREIEPDPGQPEEAHSAAVLMELLAEAIADPIAAPEVAALAEPEPVAEVEAPGVVESEVGALAELEAVEPAEASEVVAPDVVVAVAEVEAEVVALAEPEPPAQEAPLVEPEAAREVLELSPAPVLQSAAPEANEAAPLSPEQSVRPGLSEPEPTAQDIAQEVQPLIEIEVQAGRPAFVPPARPIEIEAAGLALAIGDTAAIPESFANPALAALRATPRPEGIAQTLEQPAEPVGVDVTAFLELEEQPLEIEGAAPPVSEASQAQSAEEPAEPLTQAELAEIATLAALRPTARPAAVTAAAQRIAAAEAAEAARIAAMFASATAQAITTSPRPVPRSRELSAAIERALAQAIAQAIPPAPPPAPAASAPQDDEIDEPELTGEINTMPTTAMVATQATLSGAIRLNQINLVGVFGGANNRRALVRLSNGRFQTVSVGDTLDGGQVVAISETQISYRKGNETLVLRLITGG